jgi:hypothetical protein
MEARQELRFYMEPYTPETLPLGRLAEYLARLAKVVGDHRAVHLIELQEGSTVFVNRADPEAIPAIYERVAGVKRGDAPRDAMERAQYATRAGQRHGRTVRAGRRADPRFSRPARRAAGVFLG